MAEADLSRNGDEHLAPGPHSQHVRGQRKVTSSLSVYHHVTVVSRLLTSKHMIRALPADFMPLCNFLPCLEATLATLTLGQSYDAALGSLISILILRKAASSFSCPQMTTPHVQNLISL